MVARRWVGRVVEVRGGRFVVETPEERVSVDELAPSTGFTPGTQATPVTPATGSSEVGGDAPIAAGDWVEIVGEADEAGRFASPPKRSDVRVLAASRQAEFPRLDGEWYRLRGPDGRRLRNLRSRARALGEARRYFEQQGFVEIEAPLMVPSPGLELHLDAFSVEGRYLITSPEYQLKRLLAGGMDRIYSVARCFRRGEAGPHHNPEFTMIEWYRSPGAWEDIATDVERLTAACVQAVTGGTTIRYREHELELAPPWDRMSVREAMRLYAELELDGDEPVEDLTRKARAAGFVVSDGLPWDDVFFSVFLDAVEPRLGQGKPTILYDWPVPLAALARRKPSDPRVVERFEAYAGGLELCNGFGELTDPFEQRRRFDKDALERRRRGLPVYPVDEKFLRALGEGVPPSAGVALGFDRLLMLACDASHIRDVSAFTIDEL